MAKNNIPYPSRKLRVPSGCFSQRCDGWCKRTTWPWHEGYCIRPSAIFCLFSFRGLGVGNVTTVYWRLDLIGWFPYDESNFFFMAPFFQECLDLKEETPIQKNHRPRLWPRFSHQCWKMKNHQCTFFATWMASPSVFRNYPIFNCIFIPFFLYVPLSLTWYIIWISCWSCIGLFLIPNLTKFRHSINIYTQDLKAKYEAIPESERNVAHTGPLSWPCLGGLWVEV